MLTASFHVNRTAVNEYWHKASARRLTAEDSLTCVDMMFQDSQAAGNAAPKCLDARKMGSDNMKYTVVINTSDEGYSIACPALPGCWSQGKTEEEAVANIIEAIEDYVAAVSETYMEAGFREIEVAI